MGILTEAKTILIMRTETSMWCDMGKHFTAKGFSHRILSEYCRCWEVLDKQEKLQQVHPRQD